MNGNEYRQIGKAPGARAGECAVRQFFSLGTVNRIQAYGCADSRVLDRAAARVAEIDDRMSAFKAGSDLSALSRSGGKKPAAMHEDTFRLLQAAEKFGEMSDGAFDITVRPLIELWGINKKAGLIPSKRKIESALALAGRRELQLDSKNRSAFFKRPGQAADLGGIAKGYAADEVKRILAEGGVAHALINLGGNISVLGSRPDGGPWKIGVQNPAAVRGEYMGILSVADESVVTSGSNERFFIKDGVRYHHLLDPRTGLPAQSGLLSVTVVGPSSMEADALSTAVFVLGMEKGRKLLEQCGAEAVFAAEDYNIYVTEGLLGRFSAACARA